MSELDIKSELDKIFEDDLLKCEIVESVENSARRVDLIRWTHDGTFSIAEVRKDTGKFEVTDIPETDEIKVYGYFFKNYADIAMCG